MRPWALLAASGALCLALSAALGGGGAPFGRLALALGLPRVAHMLFDDPDWRGVADYRAGNYAAAAKAFARARDDFNLGNARARQRDYAAALEAYDVARSRGDDLAVSNFDLIAAYYAGLALDPDAPIAWFTEKDGSEDPAVPSFVAQGNARAAGEGDETTNSGALLGLPELKTTSGMKEQIRVRRVFDDRFMVANDRWLATLEDVPGEYLAARITEERKRRKALGLAPPDPEDPQ